MSLKTTQTPVIRGRYLATLCLVTLGVVYGDIGTSPLYAIRECFYGPHAVEPTHDHVLGVLSLIFWALVIVISIKYLLFVVRADNHGEGGILSLTALATPIRPSGRSERWLLISIGLFGAALLYGDGVITPAISVLGAMEGLSVATPGLDPYVVPVTIVILVALFMFQRRGTAKVGQVFGPIMVIWFSVLGLLGFLAIAGYPAVLAAINPVYAVRFFMDTGWHGYLVLGSIFLTVTGGEALYADMGHFGKKPIRLDWFAVVLPSLLLNYFGQGALLLQDPTAASNPFYLLAPRWALYPMIVLAVFAAVIASQAVISGAYSLTMQAVQLGFSPRIRIDHTSRQQFGQIYIASVNWALLVGCVALVLLFQTSSNLAAAYGVAVTSTMAITTILLYSVARSRWHWSTARAAIVAGLFLIVDFAFLGATIIKVADGGWLPLVLAASIFTAMTTWKRGRRILAQHIQAAGKPLKDFINQLPKSTTRVPGTAVFMNGSASKTPPALRQNLKHNKVLHERVIFLTIKTQPVPNVHPKNRVEVESLGNGLFVAKVSYGFMENPDIPKVLQDSMKHGIGRLDPNDTTYFLGRETIIASGRPGMAIWRERLFGVMARNATTATAYFGIPPDRVVELGEQVEI